MPVPKFVMSKQASFTDLFGRCFSLDKIVDFIKYVAVILSDNHIDGGKDFGCQQIAP